MKRLNETQIFFLAFIAAGLIAAYFTPIFETTEGRYAEIAREMIESGNWIVPQFNGITHFHKPPAGYWLIASGMEIFGINNFGARFCGVIAAAITLLFTQKTAMLLTADREISKFSLYAAASSLLFIAISRITSIDIYLTATVSAALYIIFYAMKNCAGFKEGLLLGLVLGFGFMLKGPLILLFCIAPAFAVSLFNKDYRVIFKPSFALPALILFLITGFGWYLYAVLKFDNLLNYFVGYQIIDRVATNAFNRAKPFYFYFTVLIGAFPLFFYSVYASFKNENLRRYSLWVFILLPLAVFQLSESKLASYLTPLIPICSITAASAISSYKSHKPLIPLHVYSAILITLPFAASFALSFLAPFRVLALITTLFAAAIYIILYKKGKGLLSASAWAILILSTSTYAIMPNIEQNIKGYKKASEASMDEISGKRVPAVFYKSFVPSISFYRHEIVPEIFGTKREILFEKNDSYKKYYIQSEDEAKSFFSEQDKIYIYTSEQKEEIETKYGLKCDLKYKAHKLGLLFCWS